MHTSHTITCPSHAHITHHHMSFTCTHHTPSHDTWTHQNTYTYMYTHTHTPTHTRTHTCTQYPTVQEVTPPTIVAGRFGLSVINTGDLDKDGYDDVAIAAPHDAGGVVYIYRGCESGLCDSPQVRVTCLVR